MLWPALDIAAVVADGASAVAQALALHPDVCFLDIRMPGLSGLEAAQALAEDWPEALPFPLLVFVTAYDQYALQAFEPQAVDYLLKPVDDTRLAQCVHRLQTLLAGRTAAPAMAQTLEQLRALLGAPGLAAPPAAPAGGDPGAGGHDGAPGAGRAGDLLRGRRQVRARASRRSASI